MHAICVECGQPCFADWLLPSILQTAIMCKAGPAALQCNACEGLLLTGKCGVSAGGAVLFPGAVHHGDAASGAGRVGTADPHRRR